ncbi:hypothetical protein [Mycetocola spongiae]|uniref:hypothetical protein n=1 Tax=Mycetocola spongiae TaxID=2859226 RepID=UPI001CF5F220|nr:hypothetical protein [Mycetocola spongiae]UCR88278.1 hypothetical protein KXZ72_09840 [Mycetocola spongiae]
MAWIGLLLAVFFAALALNGTRMRRGVPVSPSRVDVILGILDAAVAMLLAHRIVSWGEVWPGLWFLAVLPIAGAVTALIWRWETWPTLRAGRGRGRSVIPAALHAAVLLALTAVLVF